MAVRLRLPGMPIRGPRLSMPYVNENRMMAFDDS